MTVLIPVVMVKMYYGTWQNELLSLQVWRNLWVMKNYYDSRTTKKCSTSFHTQEVEKCIKLDRFSYKMLYRSKNTFFDKMAEYGTRSHTTFSTQCTLCGSWNMSLYSCSAPFPKYFFPTSDQWTQCKNLSNWWCQDNTIMIFGKVSSQIKKKRI